jgi:hypothetical protein
VKSHLERESVVYGRRSKHRTPDRGAFEVFRHAWDGTRIDRQRTTEVQQSACKWLTRTSERGFGAGYHSASQGSNAWTSCSTSAEGSAEGALLDDGGALRTGRSAPAGRPKRFTGTDGGRRLCEVITEAERTLCAMGCGSCDDARKHMSREMRRHRKALGRA